MFTSAFTKDNYPFTKTKWEGQELI